MTVKFNTLVSRDLDEKVALETAAQRLRDQGYEADVIETAKVTKTHKPQAILRTNASIGTVRRVRLAAQDGNVSEFQKMLTVIGAAKQGPFPPCETKVG